MYARDTVLRAERTSVDKLAAAAAESTLHGHDDEKTSDALVIASDTSSRPTGAAVSSPTEACQSTHSAG